MAVVKRTRFAQYPLVAEFILNFNDAMAPLASQSGPSVDLLPLTGVIDFGSTALPAGLPAGLVWTANTMAATNWFEILALPVNAQIIGGDFQVEVPFVGPTTASVTIGDMASPNLYLSSTSLKATSWTNQPTAIVNAVQPGAAAGSPPTQMTLTNATANGITAVGQVITISGCTGTSTPYNGNFIVDSFTATTVTCTNNNLISILTLAGTPAATFITPRTALTIPGESTNLSNYLGVGQIAGSEGAAGNDVRLGLTFSGGQAASQGRVRVRVLYTIDGRGHETASQ